MAKQEFLRLPVVSAGAEFLVMGYLMGRNIPAYKAPPNNEGYDLICIHPDPRHQPQGDEVDDIGNFSYLGKLRNIRKSAEMPVEYFKHMPDDELRNNHLITDRSLLTEDNFESFVKARRELILANVTAFLGR